MDEKGCFASRQDYGRLDTSSSGRAKETAGVWPLSQGGRPFDQNSSFDEFDGTFAPHCVQAHGNAFASGAYNGSNFAVGKRNVDKNALWFGNPVSVRKLGKQPIESRGNRIKREVGEAALGMFKPLTDQTESAA